MKKRKSKKNIRIIILRIIAIILTCTIIFTVFIKISSKSNSLENTPKDTHKNNALSHYNKYVVTNKETNLYDQNKKSIGKVGKNVELTLDNDKIDAKTKYFKIVTFDTEYYIEYEDVDKIDSLSSNDNRYENYILFNQNIITKERTSFFDEEDNLIYEFNESFTLPIIIKDDNKYGVEFNSKLLYVKKDEVTEVVDSNNSNDKNSNGIPVLNYHFVYEDNETNCNEEICHPASQIKKHFSYIKDNGFFTPTMWELEKYIDGKIQLPQKSVVITFDDGTKAEVAKKYVDMYEINATLFLITSWFSKDQFESDYFEIHSHGDNLHDGGECPGGQGGAIKCRKKEALLSDLKSSRQKLDGSTVFCYPFYEYNDYSIEMLKEAGFTMAFAGEYAGGKIKVTPGINKFKLPRWVIVNWTTMEKFISYINGGE